MSNKIPQKYQPAKWTILLLPPSPLLITINNNISNLLFRERERENSKTAVVSPWAIGQAFACLTWLIWSILVINSPPPPKKTRWNTKPQHLITVGCSSCCQFPCGPWKSPINNHVLQPYDIIFPEHSLATMHRRQMKGKVASSHCIAATHIYLLELQMTLCQT